MSLQALLLATVIAGFGAAQYALMVHAMRDLIHRPRVRGGNKVLWGLAILCIPIGGALLYGWMGPASFIRRPSRVRGLPESLPRIASDRPTLLASRKIAPIRPVKPTTVSSARRRTPYDDAMERSGSATRPVPEPTRIRRTGS